MKDSMLRNAFERGRWINANNKKKWHSIWTVKNNTTRNLRVQFKKIKRYSLLSPPLELEEEKYTIL